MDKYCDTSKLSIRQIDKPTAKKMIVKYITLNYGQSVV